MTMIGATPKQFIERIEELKEIIKVKDNQITSHRKCMLELTTVKHIITMKRNIQKELEKDFSFKGRSTSLSEGLKVNENFEAEMKRERIAHVSGRIDFIMTPKRESDK